MERSTAIRAVVQCPAGGHDDQPVLVHLPRHAFPAEVGVVRQTVFLNDVDQNGADLLGVIVHLWQKKEKKCHIKREKSQPLKNQGMKVFGENIAVGIFFSAFI